MFSTQLRLSTGGSIFVIHHGLSAPLSACTCPEGIVPQFLEIPQTTSCNFSFMEVLKR